MPDDAPAAVPIHDTDLHRLFGVVFVGTVFFNVFVLLPLFLLAIFIAPGGPNVAIFGWVPEEATQSRLAALFFLPAMASITGVLMGLQNAVVVCAGLLASRWVSRAKDRLVSHPALNDPRTN